MKFVNLFVLFGTLIGKIHLTQAASSLSSVEKEKLVRVLSLNDGLFNALLKDDQAIVAKSSLELKKGLANTSGKIIELKNKASILDKIKASNTKEKNLAIYAEFLPSLVEIARTYKPDSQFEIYYCPMEKKYWIQNSKTNQDVRNVFAQEMLECGHKKS